MKKKIRFSTLRNKKEAEILRSRNGGKDLIALFLLDQGYEQRGMPEMYYPTEYINSDSSLKERTILITDGRFSGATYGFSFGYMEEWYGCDDLKDGSLILFDFKNKRINLLNDLQFFKYGQLKPVKRPVLAGRPCFDGLNKGF